MPGESIGPNKRMLYRGIALQVLCVAVAGLFSYALVFEISLPNSKRAFSDGVVVALTVIGVVGHARRFYAMPYWVIVDDERKTLKITYLFRKPVFVRPENMLSYNDMTIKISRRSGTMIYSGFYLHLDNGKKILFSERNFVLEDTEYIESMLAYWGVRKGEDE